MTPSFPSVPEAQELLRWANEQNPGQWYDHCVVAGNAARSIAEKAGLDADRAQVHGLLHDVGRHEGVRGLHHILSGYELLMEKGWEDAARICITHSFPIQDLEVYMGKDRDVTDEEMKKIVELIETAEYDDYDRLIQLCDAICLPQGIVPIEVRLFDVAYRHGPTDRTQGKWRAYLAIKEHFDQLCGCNLFSLFEEDLSCYFQTYTKP